LGIPESPEPEELEELEEVVTVGAAMTVVDPSL